MIKRRERGTGRTIAQLVSAWQGGRHLAARDVLAAEAAPHGVGGFYVFTGSARIHSDRFESRCFDAIAALAAMGANNAEAF